MLLQLQLELQKFRQRTSIVNQISKGIATITAQGLNVTGIVTATS